MNIMKVILGIFLAGFILTLQACKKDKVSDETVANFSLAGYDKALPATITFVNNSSNATSYFWELGDGTTSTLPNLSHSYSAIGTYFITLRATGPKGTDTVCKQMTLSDIPDPSKTYINYFLDKCDGITPVNASFHSINPLSIFHEWDFGDGVRSQEKSPIIRFSGPGTYLIKHSSQINGRRDTTTLGLTFY